MRAVAATILNGAIHWITVRLWKFSEATLARRVIIADEIVASDDLRCWEGHIPVAYKVVMGVIDTCVNNGNLHAVAGAGLRRYGLRPDVLRLNLCGCATIGWRCATAATYCAAGNCHSLISGNELHVGNVRVGT